jgi:hypothetical protein
MATDSIRLRRQGFEPRAENARPRAQSIDGQEHFEILLYADLPRVLRALGLMFCAACLLAEGLLLYRLWSELTGTIHTSGVDSQLFLLSSRFLAPFASFETVPATFSHPVVEYSLLVALVAYLLVSVAAILATFEFHRIASKYAPNPWAGRFDMASIVRGYWLADVIAENAWHRAATTARQGAESTTGITIPVFRRRTH